VAIQRSQQTVAERPAARCPHHGGLDVPKLSWLLIPEQQVVEN
jgi:hypothetical protein